MSSSAEDSPDDATDVEQPSNPADYTFRLWEARYGPRVAADESDSPRHPGADLEIQRLIWVAVRLARGGDRTEAANRRQTGRPAPELLKSLLRASGRMDPLAVVMTLTEAGFTLGLADCIDEVLLPAMRQIGLWWAAGRCSQAQEQLTTEAVRAWVDHGSAFAPAPTRKAPVLLACGPRDRHTIGLEALALLLRIQGWQCRVLGDRISAAVLLTATQASAPAGVVVVSHLAMNRGHALQSLAVIEGEHIPLFYAGNAFGTRSDRAQLPGHYLGTNMGQACTAICEVLDRVGDQ